MLDLELDVARDTRKKFSSDNHFDDEFRTIYIVPVTIDEFMIPRGIHSSFPTQSIRLRSGSSFYLRHYLLYYLSMQSFYDCLFHVQRKDKSLHMSRQDGRA